MNPNWILYNYLSQISPMPEAWDVTSTSAAAGSGHCSTGVFGAASTITACKAVEKFLDAEALKTSTYTSKLWQVVDGPYKLVSFDTIGNAEFVPNPSYSGPVKSKVGHVYLESYTTSNAEQSALYSGKLTIGYVDPTTLPGPAPAVGKVGPNISQLQGKYNLVTGDAVVVQLRAAQLRPERPQGNHPPTAVHPPGAADVDQPACHREEGEQQLRRRDLQPDPAERPVDGVRGDLVPVHLQPLQGQGAAH